MKKLLLIALLFTIFSNAQESQIIRIGTNPKIALTGAYDYSEGGDFALTFSWVTKFENQDEAGIFTEYIELDPHFFTFGFIYNKNINIIYSNTFETLLGAEFLYLQRGISYKDDWVRNKQEFLTLGVNAILNINLHENFLVGLRLNLKYRPDTISMYDGQKTSWGGYIDIGWRFRINRRYR